MGCNLQRPHSSNRMCANHVMCLGNPCTPSMTVLRTMMLVILIMLSPQYMPSRSELVRIVLCRGVQLHSTEQKLPCYDGITLQGDTAFHLRHVADANVTSDCISICMHYSVLTFLAHFTKRLQLVSLPLVLSTHELSAWQACGNGLLQKRPIYLLGFSWVNAEWHSLFCVFCLC